MRAGRPHASSCPEARSRVGVPGPDHARECDLLGGSQAGRRDHEERGPFVDRHEAAPHAGRNEREVLGVASAHERHEAFHAIHALVGGQLVVEPRRRRPSLRALDRDARGQVQDDADRVNEIGPAHPLEPVVGLDGLGAPWQPVPPRHRRVQPAPLPRQQEKRSARHDEKQEGPRRHPVPPAAPAFASAAPARPVGTDSEAIHVPAKEREHRRQQRHREKATGEQHHEKPRHADGSLLGEGNHQERGETDEHRERGEKDGPARPPRRLLGRGRRGHPGGEGLAEPTHHQEGIVDPEAQADHGRQCLNEDRDREELGKPPGHPDRKHDREDADRGVGRMPTPGGGGGGGFFGGRTRASASRASAALTMAARLRGASPVQPSQISGYFFLSWAASSAVRWRSRGSSDSTGAEPASRPTMTRQPPSLPTNKGLFVSSEDSAPATPGRLRMQSTFFHGYLVSGSKVMLCPWK